MHTRTRASTHQARRMPTPPIELLRAEATPSTRVIELVLYDPEGATPETDPVARIE
jgi:hypothetical protein